MPVGIVGYKRGMTRVFTEQGESVPVTVIEVQPNYITQIKTVEKDGYRALQITAGVQRASRVNKPLAGQFAKANVEAGAMLREFRLADDEYAEAKAGDAITLDIFEEEQFVDVRAKSRGKGFQGGVKRHNFHMQDATHGNSVSHRALGSTGQCQTPGRVLRGKKMPGQMGNVMCTVQKQKIVRVDSESNVLLVKGNVPGAPGAEVVITRSLKEKGAK